MGVHRNRSGSVGRPFTKGNPGGGRPKGAQNKATREIKEFARNFLMSDKYRRTLERRILAGTAPQMEVMLHHYAFGKPTAKYVEPAPPGPPEAELTFGMTNEEKLEIYGLITRRREIQQAAAARSAAARDRATIRGARFSARGLTPARCTRAATSATHDLRASGSSASSKEGMGGRPRHAVPQL
jgi:hypothetical protein